jgi:HepT-like protein
VKQKLALLLALMDSHWLIIADIFDKLDQRQSTRDSSEAGAVFTAYLLHNLYGAVEELLKQVALTFENRIDDLGQFHAELLRRMSIEIPGFRPAFLTPQSRDPLHELRRFRHVFRHAYDYHLDPRRISELAAVAVGLRSVLTRDKDRFREFLVNTIETPGEGS